jgi:PAS domain S-box-containing protein
MFTKGLDGVILDWNPGAQKIFGYSAEEAVGQNIALLVPPELLNEELSTRDRIARGDEVPAFRTLRVRKDGGSVEIQLRQSPVRDGCGVLKAIAHLSHVIG